MVLVWVIILIGAIVLEIMTVQFVSIWFAFAALVAVILAGLGTPVWAQLLCFVAVTLILLIATRPLVKKLRGEYVRTNADMNIGKLAVVTEDVINERSLGRAIIGGVSWKAVSEDGEHIPEGSTVVIKDVDGAKLIVSQK